MPNSPTARILAHLATGPATFIQLALALQIKADTLNKAIGQLLDSGQVERVECDGIVGIKVIESEVMPTV